MGTAVGVTAVVVVGLMVGVEFAVAAFVNPILDRLPNAGGLAARTDGARVLGRVMPFWYVGSVALAALWMLSSWGQPGMALVVTAAVLLVTSVLMSIALLVPINSRVARWTSGTAPVDWREQVHQWDRLHHVRVAVIVAAFALLVVAAFR